MFQDSPIYDRLISERGDVPLQVRREAERVSRELEFVMQPLNSFGAPPVDRQPHPGVGWQRSALPPGGQH
ncbi:hypothetical protein [Streptomyces cupreus]|uniref:Uncharacterized protein n=1 Tax=Streptomyces cupreus TaxID=2759956 RepID=A0A7X1J7A7_9ACTN|nr:hypothetical protein [Streptomyces cupreus]